MISPEMDTKPKRRSLTIVFSGEAPSETFLKNIKKTVSSLGTVELVSVCNCAQSERAAWEKMIQKLSPDFSGESDSGGSLASAETGLGSKRFLFEEVERFLIELPDSDAYEKLRFKQNLVRQNFDRDRLFHQPQLIESVLFPVFLEYKKAYIDRYFSELQTSQEALQKIQKQREPLRQKIFAAKKLAQLPWISRQGSILLEQDLGDFFQQYPVFELNEKEIRHHLEKVPIFRNFRLGQGWPKNEFQELSTRIETELQEKMKQIKNRAVVDLTTKNDTEGVKKLLELLHLSQLDELVPLLASEQSDAVFFTLQKIFP